ncbi:hypothetical protein [Natrinema salifodinae]|uniref:Uncharacterized protein n=1 Tax=Natrinema salifodinae TaxID=1202768 RepID=A0A1I0P737_9EURY|nr:hypothetical protein [Natrinema salifodinae]SEW10017.1 hypothetical protein SAMN05216285_2214 [Natrinema salifodinae]
MTDRRDAFAVRWTPPRGPARKLVFKPRTVGGYDREEYERRNGEWRCIGREIVSHVKLESADGVAVGE